MVASRAIEKALLDIAKDHAITRTRKNMRDAIPHRASPKDGDGFDFSYAHQTSYDSFCPQARSLLTLCYEGPLPFLANRAAKNAPVSPPTLFRGRAFDHFANNFLRPRDVSFVHEQRGHPRESWRLGWRFPLREGRIQQFA